MVDLLQEMVTLSGRSVKIQDFSLTAYHASCKFPKVSSDLVYISELCASSTTTRSLPPLVVFSQNPASYTETVYELLDQNSVADIRIPGHDRM